MPLDTTHTCTRTVSAYSFKHWEFLQLQGFLGLLAPIPAEEAAALLEVLTINTNNTNT